MVKNNNILIKQDLVANPDETATATLSKLKYNGTTYSISGGSGSTYTGTNGITVDNTNYTIGIDSSSSTETTMKKLKVTDSVTMDKGATFTASSGAELTVNCDATFNSDTLFTSTVDLASATIQVPSIALTGTSGSLTTAQWTTLTASTIPYFELDNNKYYYVGRTLEGSGSTAIIRTQTYYCPKVGKIVITATGTGTYTYTWQWTSDSLYQHSLYLTYTDTTNNSYNVGIAIFTNSATALTTSTVVAALQNYFGTGSSVMCITTGRVRNYSTSKAYYLDQAFPVIDSGSFNFYYYTTYGDMTTETTFNCPFAGSSTYTLTSVHDSVVQIR